MFAFQLERAGHRLKAGPERVAWFAWEPPRGKTRTEALRYRGKSARGNARMRVVPRKECLSSLVLGRGLFCYPFVTTFGADFEEKRCLYAHYHNPQSGGDADRLLP